MNPKENLDKMKAERQHAELRRGVMKLRQNLRQRRKALVRSQRNDRMVDRKAIRAEKIRMLELFINSLTRIIEISR